MQSIHYVLIFVFFALIMISLVSAALYQINKILQIIAKGEANIVNLYRRQDKVENEFGKLENKVESLFYDFNLHTRLHRKID